MSLWTTETAAARKQADTGSFIARRWAQGIGYNNRGVGGGRGRDAADGGGGKDGLYFLPDLYFN